MQTNPEQRLAIIADLYQLHYECLYNLSFCLYNPDLIFLVVVLDKQHDILGMMMKHGIIEVLCQIFSTSQDKDTLV